jgi:integrase
MLTEEQVILRLTQALKLKGRDWKTVDSYSRTARHYYRFSLAHGGGKSSEQIATEYLSLRVTRDRVSASTQNHDLAAILALYAAFGRPLGNVDALRAKRPVYARHCPSRDEVVALLGALHDAPAVPSRTVALMLYGCGLRIGECLEIRLKDVRLSESRLVLRAPKHGHDRVVPLPDVLHPLITRQIEYARRVFVLDQERRPPLPLQVPFAMSRKYPRSPYSVGWEFLFPSPRPESHPETRELLRWHLPDWTIQTAFAEACDRSDLVARITPHCLRHAYATHFAGDIRDLQAVLGHKSLETTQGYRHPHLDRVRSPLAELPVCVVG